MKKLTALLALALAVAMLSACCLAEADPFGKYDEPVTVHFVRSTDDTLDANYFSQHPDKTMTYNLWCDLYRDVLNVNVEYDWIVKGGDEYDQKLNIALGVGDIPEFVNVNTLQLKQLAEADLIMPLEDIYEEYASDFTKEIMLETGTSPFDAATIDGHLYGLPNVDSTLMIADLLWVRTDWLEKLGLPIPTTMDEVIETAKAFCAADFDGNGEDDTVGIAIAKDLWGQLFSLRGFFNGFDAYPGIWVEDAEGKLVYGSTLPGAKDALATLHQMYEDGLIDPEFGVKDGGKVAEATTAGRCGLFFGAPTETMTSRMSTLEDLQDEVFTKIILGETPVDDFDKFVDDFNTLGGADITAEVNEWYDSVK